MARGLAHSVDVTVQLREARDPALPKSRMAELAISRDLEIRAAVAARPDCPLGLAVSLADDAEVEVRMALAANPVTQQTLLDQLAGDRNPAVPLAVASNPSSPPALLERLAMHRNHEVRRTAVHQLATMSSRASAYEFAPSATPDLVRLIPDAPTAVTPAAWANGVADSHDTIPELEPELPPQADLADEPGDDAEIYVRTAPVRGFRPPRR